MSDREELEHVRRHRERIERMRREKERRLRLQTLVKRAAPAAGCILLLGILICLHGVVARGTEEGEISGQTGTEPSETVGQRETERKQTESGAIVKKILAGSQAAPDEASGRGMTGATYAAQDITGEGAGGVAPGNITASSGLATIYSAHITDDTSGPPAEVESPNVIFLDLETGDILAQRGYRDVISPASMTKVLTVLVAAEHVTDLDDTFTITVDITDYSYVNDCSSAGFAIGETVTVRDLFYGTILPSGADAALALAVYVAGSHEDFVEMMNAKAEELGLSGTAHFTNCVGLYDEDHHCTVYDMAMLMEAAMDNEWCRTVLNAHTYTTTATDAHPEGIALSNWFLRRIEDKDTGGEVICAKTGYVVQSKSCAVSYGRDLSGREYVCVTAGAPRPWRCIYDHVALYKEYARE
ncbi:MAG: serine hydrolase [Clostridium sp.]|nr:serine hydrolase [Acetatifactor muris]MCM1527184.1 serine hydrolase [Bacteroides sp.]MCM1562491.1 serine hydrolase [Clostridium sp.]